MDENQYNSSTLPELGIGLRAKRFLRDYWVARLIPAGVVCWLVAFGIRTYIWGSLKQKYDWLVDLSALLMLLGFVTIVVAMVATGLLMIWRSSPSRFRFSLRSLFLLVTVASFLVLGFTWRDKYRAARHAREFHPSINIIGSLSEGDHHSILNAVYANAKVRSDRIIAIATVDVYQAPFGAYVLVYADCDLGGYRCRIRVNKKVKSWVVEDVHSESYHWNEQ